MHGKNCRKLAVHCQYVRNAMNVRCRTTVCHVLQGCGAKQAVMTDRHLICADMLKAGKL